MGNNLTKETMIADARKSTSCYFWLLVSLNKPLAYGNGFVISFKMRNTGICISQVLQCHLEIMFSNKIYIVMSFVRQVTQHCKIMWELIIITIQMSNHQETRLENSNQFAVSSIKWMSCGIAEIFFQRTRHNTMHSFAINKMQIFLLSRSMHQILH